MTTTNKDANKDASKDASKATKTVKKLNIPEKIIKLIIEPSIIFHNSNHKKDIIKNLGFKIVDKKEIFNPENDNSLSNRSCEIFKLGTWCKEKKITILDPNGKAWDFSKNKIKSDKSDSGNWRLYKAGYITFLNSILKGDIIVDKDLKGKFREVLSTIAIMKSKGFTFSIK